MHHVGRIRMFVLSLALAVPSAGLTQVLVSEATTTPGAARTTASAPSADSAKRAPRAAASRDPQRSDTTVPPSDTGTRPTISSHHASTSNEQLTGVERFYLDGLEDRVAKKVAAEAGKAQLDKWATVVLSFFSALVGAAISLFAQGRQFRHAQRAADRSAGFAALSKLAEYRNQQLHEFYAPLRALLQQSVGVRNELYRHLVRQPPADMRYRYQIDPTPEEPSKQSLWVDQPGEEPKPFRLIDQLKPIAQHCPQYLPLVGDMVRISRSIQELIYIKIGLLESKSHDLAADLSAYLAHSSILHDVYAKAMADPELLGSVSYVSTFPRKLHVHIERDFAVLTKRLEDWNSMAAELWSQTSLTQASGA